MKIDPVLTWNSTCQVVMLVFVNLKYFLFQFAAYRFPSADLFALFLCSVSLKSLRANYSSCSIAKQESMNDYPC